MQVKKSLIAAMALVALGAGAFGANAVFAKEDGARPANNLVSAIAERFNLDPAEVQQVFEAEHEKMHPKLTQEQADLLAVKHEEHRVFMEGLKDLSDEERGEAMKTHREEFRAWAEENNIQVGALMRSHHSGPDQGKHESMVEKFHERKMNNFKAE